MIPPKTETALRIYLENPQELSNEHIRKLFDVKSSSKICAMKKEVRKEQIERGVKTWNAQNISTKVAYDVWGIDVDELEKNYRRLRRLKMTEAEQDERLQANI